ncbi:MAG TPA: hypothetical protein VGP88_06675, partial [Thermoplasmata archaeon]|nr:hypothetical protein [Thermoplasmata archaeon]
MASPPNATSPATGSPPPSAPRSSTPRVPARAASGGFRSWFHRLEDRFFPPLTGPTAHPRGVLAAELPEWPGAVVALAIGLAVAALLE